MRGKITLIIWESEYFIKAGYDPQKRCREVSDRFELFQQTGDLSKIVPGRTNKQPVLCGIGSLSNYTGNCPSSNVLMTLRRGDNAQGMVNQIGELNLVVCQRNFAWFNRRRSRGNKYCLIGVKNCLIFDPG